MSFSEYKRRQNKQSTKTATAKPLHRRSFRHPLPSLRRSHPPPIATNTFTSTSSRLFHHVFLCGSTHSPAPSLQTPSIAYLQKMCSHLFGTLAAHAVSPQMFVTLWTDLTLFLPIPKSWDLVTQLSMALELLSGSFWMITVNHTQSKHPHFWFLPPAHDFSPPNHISRNLSCLDTSCSSIQTSTGIQLTLPYGTTLGIPYNAANNLPITSAARPLSLAKSNFEYNLCVTDEANQNLTAPTKETLLLALPVRSPGYVGHPTSSQGWTSWKQSGQVACGQVCSSQMCFLPVWKAKTQIC